MPSREDIFKLNDKRTKSYADGIASLKTKIHDPEHPDPMFIDWGEPDISETEFRAVAFHMIGDAFTRDDVEDLSDQELADKYLRDEQNITNLVNNVDFRGFVQVLLAQNNPEVFSDFEELKNAWEEYEHKAKDQRLFLESEENWQDFLEDDEVHKGVRDQDAGLLATYEDEEDDEDSLEDEKQEKKKDEVIDDEEDEPSGVQNDDEKIKLGDDTDVDMSDDYSDRQFLNLSLNESVKEEKNEELDASFVAKPPKKETYHKASYEKGLKNITNIAKNKEKELIDTNKFLNPTDYEKGADLVIAGMLSDSAMQRQLLDPNAGFFKKDQFSTGKLNETLTTMRMQLVKDPVFQRCLSTCPTPGEFYGKYKSAVRREVNRRIDNKFERDIKSRVEKEKNEIRKGIEKDVTVELNEEMQQALKDTYKALNRLNENHKCSDQMKNLMKALKAVQDKNTVTYKELETVNDFAAIYHKDRQGILFSPFTDYGKLRLNTVEKLLRKTDNELKPVRESIEKEVNTAYKKAADQKNMSMK